MRKSFKIIAADIGGTNSRFSLVDNRYELLRSAFKRTTLFNKEQFVDSIVDSIAELKDDLKDVGAIVLGIPGPIAEGGYVIDLPNIHIKDIPLGDILRQRFGLPVFIRNDAEMACFAEAALGNGKDYHRVFFITISTGLGGALVVDMGLEETPIEIGHTPYVYKGEVTYYEYLASGTGIINLSRINGLDVDSANDFFQFVKIKDPAAMMVYGEWLKVLGDFLAHIEANYHPDIIVVTGGVFNAKSVFWDDLCARNPHSNLKECHFDQKAGLIGAACYAFQQLNN